MAKRTKFQAELILRSRPPSAFDVLREAAIRLQSSDAAYPPGLIPAIGGILAGVLDEVDGANVQRTEDKRLKDIGLETEKSK
jgi:hypothetical protein